MEKQPVTVTILGRPYKLKILAHDESYLRDAASFIESQAKQYGKTFNHQDNQDLLAMVALEQITELTKIRANMDYRNDKLQGKLEEIDTALNEYLHPTQNSL